VDARIGLLQIVVAASIFLFDCCAARHFVLSVNNDDFDDLDEPQKLYQAPPTVKLRGMTNIPVVDETGEDYMYPSESFVPVSLPGVVMRCLKRLNRAPANTRPSR
jgi:hypothetical protein